ncbi:MAG: zinc-ribbon domain-containing protein, partial [Promethearchaeota archaeon]
PGVVCIFLAAVDLFTGNGFGWFLWPSVPIMLIAYIAVDKHANSGYYRNIRHQTMPLANQTTQVSYQRDYHRQNVSNQRLIKFCPRCGEPIEPDFLFCEYCGQKLR